MKKMIRQLYISAAIAAAALSPQVHAATLIDFEPPALTGLYLAGDSFTQNGYKMTVGFDAGIVDTAGAFPSGGPTGNATQFYSQLNEGELILEREDGGLFSLDGFDAAFAPLSPAAGGTTALMCATWLAGPLLPPDAATNTPAATALRYEISTGSVKSVFVPLTE